MILEMEKAFSRTMPEAGRDSQIKK